MKYTPTEEDKNHILMMHPYKSYKGSTAIPVVLNQPLLMEGA